MGFEVRTPKTSRPATSPATGQATGPAGSRSTWAVILRADKVLGTKASDEQKESFACRLIAVDALEQIRLGR